MQKKTEVALPCSLFKKQKLGWRSEAELEKKYKKKHARFTRDMPTDAGLDLNQVLCWKTMIQGIVGTVDEIIECVLDNSNIYIS